MVVRYRIQDATADVDREVEGRIVVTVQGRPEAPGTPSVSSVQDRTVVLSWTPPADNGAAITGYTVSSTRGDYKKQCAATTCTLDGLTNNVEYNFTVIATNRVGDSDPSPPSETARPDARPDTPAPPTLTFGDRSLERRVGDADDPRIAGGVLHPRDLAGAAVGHRAEDRRDGQLDGVGRARERRRVPGARAGAQPRARPVELERVVRHRDPRACSRAAGGAERRRACSRWATRRSCRSRGSSPRPTAPTSRATSCRCCRAAAVVRTHPEHPRRAALAGRVARPRRRSTTRSACGRATRRAGASGARPRRRGAPSACPVRPSAVSAQPGDRSLTVSYSPAAGNGATGGELRYEYSLNGGGWTALPGNNVISGLNNGTSYTVALRAYTALDGVRYDGPASAPSAAQIPYGPVGNPGARRDPERSRHHVLVERAGAERARRSPRCRSASTAAAGRTSRNSGSRTNTYALQHDAHDRRARAGCRGSVERGQVGVGHDGRSAAAARLDRRRARPRSDSDNCSTSSCAYFDAEHPGLPRGQLPRLLRERPDGEFAGGATALDPRQRHPSSSAATTASRATQVWVAHRGLGRRPSTRRGTAQPRTRR